MKTESRKQKAEIARLLAALIATTSLAAIAQSPDPAHGTNSLPSVLVTGTRLAVAPENTSTPVTVITREEIDRRQIQFVADALRAEPGVDVARTGQPGGLTSVFLRGANNSHTLVLVDGIRVNNAFNNAYDFNNLSVDNIERIEVLRGPQSTLYGSEALGGVINIVTKRGCGEPTGSVQAEYGSNDALLGRGSLAVGTKRFSLAAEASGSRTDNERINSDFEDFNLSSRAGYTFSDRLTASVLATYLHSEAGTPNDRFTDDPNDLSQTENWLVGLNVDARPADFWDVKLTASHARERGAFDQPVPNPPFLFGNYAAETIAFRDQVDWQNIFKLAEGHRLLAGATYDRSDADYTDSFSAFSETVAALSLYAQYEFAPTERFTATAGGRIDDYDSFGTHETYRLGVRWTAPGSGTILRANAGTGFRAPSIRELYWPFFGNPNLKPEESTGWDAGVEQTLVKDHVTAGVTFFHNDYDNLINGFPPVNVNQARTLGLETFATWTPVKALSFRAAYTWLDATDRATGLQLERRPEHRGSLLASWQIVPALSANASLMVVGERPDQDFSTFPSARVTLPGYTKIDLALNWKLRKNVSLYARVENLTDEQYEEAYGFPALGRTGAAGMVVRF